MEATRLKMKKVIKWKSQTRKAAKIRTQKIHSTGLTLVQYRLICYDSNNIKNSSVKGIIQEKKQRLMLCVDYRPCIILFLETKQFLKIYI